MIQENIEITTLSNGIRVVSETVTHVQSVSLGIWVGVGSRDEEMRVRGVTHFIEHMLFKGTKKRDARQIADEIESRGGSLNAFTDKEYTCYYAKALAEHVDVVMDVLTDMLRNSLLEPEELRREQNVVLEEIKRYKDQPDDLVHDVFAQTLWKTHPLGRPIIGTDKTVAGLNRDDLLRYIETHYTPDRIVVAAAGNVPHTEIVALAEKHLGKMGGQTYQRKPRKMPQASGHEKKVRKRTEQVHFCYGSEAFSQLDDDRYALTILDTTLGGNMSSRLFQEIREKRGLAYAIGSYSVSYLEGGFFTIYGGTSPGTFEQVMDLSRTEIEKVKKHNLTQDEVSKAQTQIRGALVLSLENMSGRMMRMGKSLLYFNRVISLDEIITKINNVTLDDIARISCKIFDEERLTLAAVGPFKREAA
jgi:predicted Zn-dependent peptidase